MIFLLLACTTTLPGGNSDSDSASDPIEYDESFRSRLPLVRIDTRDVQVDYDELWDDEGRAWTTVDATFIDTDANGWAQWTAEPAFEGQAGMHIRGNSSAGYEKKSYALETRDENDEDMDVSLLGLPEEEDWILHGPYSDKTLMRNALMYDWSREIGRYAARVRFIELFVEDNGDDLSEEDYRGVYVLMEKIKRESTRVDIAEIESSDESEPEITGGYLMKKDWVEGDHLETRIYEDVLLLIDPDPSEITDAQRTWLENWLHEFETVLSSDDFDDPETGYAAYIDVDSFVDHMLLVELGRNVDGYVLSTWLYKEREGPLSMGPIWDYNGALGGADYFESWEPEGWHYENSEFPADNPTCFRWYERLLEDPGFTTRIAERWAEHRAGALATEELHTDIDAYASLLEDAAERNFERWEILGEYVWPNSGGWEERLSHAEEVDYLKAWLTERTAWLDTAVLEL